ncbi:hypothetical protein BB559_001910 [Furculomyces boomerangus]|uniref:Phosphotransferase n=2 Tax=Harpellales TaxID=61421 RepID=A0A2T9YZK2_9FUNG|nr:hypothetical protein BB559_001910 [Furculomyces boomerangus]PWA02276.1 hypothetical protein BB558_001592 [Smittium angustum]
MSLNNKNLNTRLDTLLTDLETQLLVDDNKFNNIARIFQEEMTKGLEENRDHRNLKMLPSFVSKRPNGQEKGQCLAIDLGGTNLRIFLMELVGNSDYNIIMQSSHVVTDEAKNVNPFRWIAERTKEFFVKVSESNHNLGDNTIPCGFTFSYPIFQKSIQTGILVSWTKGFTAPNFEGKDVVKILQDELDKACVKVKITAIANDTVSLLVASGYMYPNSLIGTIFGTGNNGCYWEKVSNIKKLESDTDANEMLINIEWGAFDNDLELLPFTMHDNKLHRESPKYGFQSFEKMISGLYLGEVVRNTLLWLIDNRVLFNGRSSEFLNTPYKLDTAFVSSIVADESENLDNARSVITNDFCIHNPTFTECQTVKRVCEAASLRAKRLSAAAICAVLEKRKDILSEGATIGLDGSMYEHFPGFGESLNNSIRNYFGDQIADRIKLKLIRDGSILGAAIIAIIEA